MRQLWSEKLKGWVRPLWYRTLYPRRPVYECPICGYRGPFKDKRVSRSPDVVRQAAKCVGCGAAERHRIQFLVINEYLADWDAGQRKVLHIAPEFCLQPRLHGLFGAYHTADLFRDDVDFKEDIQKMSFADGAYDCLFVSRVITSIPDMEAAVREMRRVLKPGGMVIISEAYIHEKTKEFGRMRGSQARQVGMDALDLYGRYFAKVDRVLASRYDPKYQLANRMRVDGKPADDFPEAVRVAGVGYMELVAVCHA